LEIWSSDELVRRDAFRTYGATCRGTRRGAIDIRQEKVEQVMVSLLARVLCFEVALKE